MSHLTQEQLRVLNDKLTAKIPEIISYFQLDPGENDSCYYCECPIHRGDATAALNIYKEGFWCCRTKGCHKTFRSTIIGLIRGLLSNKYCQWLCPGDKVYGFAETLRFCQDFVGNVPLETSEEDEAISGFLKQHAKLYIPEKESPTRIDKAYIRRNLKIPDFYLLQRNFDAAILRKYDIGACLDKNKKFYKRAVIPIFDVNHENVIGFTARSHFEQCTTCKLYHEGDCPDKSSRKNFAKWINSYKSPVDSTLYNLWFAKHEIPKTQSIILCEGPLDVLRVVSAGYHNVVGFFGSSFTERKQIILEKLPLRKIIVLMDNDEAGHKCRDEVLDRLSRIYKVVAPKYVGKDVEKMSEVEIQRLLKKC